MKHIKTNFNAFLNESKQESDLKSHFGPDFIDWLIEMFKHPDLQSKIKTENGLRASKYMKEMGPYVRNLPWGALELNRIEINFSDNTYEVRGTKTLIPENKFAKLLETGSLNQKEIDSLEQLYDYLEEYREGKKNKLKKEQEDLIENLEDIENFKDTEEFELIITDIINDEDFDTILPRYSEPPRYIKDVPVPSSDYIILKRKNHSSKITQISELIIDFDENTISIKTTNPSKEFETEIPFNVENKLEKFKQKSIRDWIRTYTFVGTKPY